MVRLCSIWPLSFQRAPQKVRQKSSAEQVLGTTKSTLF